MSTSAEEQSFLDVTIRRSLNPINAPQKVFLYEVSQLSDSDDDRATQFRIDLQSFLGLRTPIDPMIWYKPGVKHEDEKVIGEVKAKKIDICSKRYGKEKRA